MAILLTVTLILFAQILYLMFSIKRRLSDLEDIIHGIHHDVDIKLEELEIKVKNGTSK